MRITAGLLALANVTFLVHEDEWAAEDVLLRLHVLKHLGIHTETMFGKHGDNLNGDNCSDIQPNVPDGGLWKVGRFMIARLNHLHGYEQKTLFQTMIGLK